MGGFGLFGLLWVCDFACAACVSGLDVFGFGWTVSDLFVWCIVFWFCLIGGFDYADLFASYIAAVLDLLRFVLVGLGFLCGFAGFLMGLSFVFVL